MSWTPIQVGVKYRLVITNGSFMLKIDIADSSDVTRMNVSSGIDTGLLSYIRESGWTDGNPNFDNDLNIAWFYLYTSSLLKPPLGDPTLAYTTVLSSFKDFDETYWVTEADVRRVSEEIVGRMFADPEWMRGILEKIVETCDALETFARSTKEQTTFSDLSNSELRPILEEHMQLHLAVYNFARIPEALDRGYELFSSLLRAHLDAIIEEKTQTKPNVTDLNRAFSSLVAPVEASFLEEAEVELLQLALDIKKDSEVIAGLRQAELFQKKRKYIWLYLKPLYRERILAFINKFGFSFYHGYSNRSLPTEAEIIDRLGSIIANDPAQDLMYKQARLRSNKDTKTQLFSEYNIQEPWRGLYELYPQIGLAKMYRRNAQLVNFEFLDRILFEIARRFQLPEAVVRAAIPTELSSLLDDTNPKEQQEIVSALRARADNNFLYYIHGLEHGLIDQPELIAQIIETISNTSKIETEVLHGSQVWPGEVEGYAVQIFRPEDLEISFLPPGSEIVIVSGSTDPDLMYAIKAWQEKRAISIGAILTETGGITCHAAITARELEIPTIVGIRGLLQNIKTGDRVHVNADEGIITRLEESLSLSRELPLPSVFNTFDYTIKDLGAKAYNLSVLYQHKEECGYEMLPAFFLPPEDVAAEISVARSYKSRKEFTLSDETIGKVIDCCRILGWNQQTKIIIRSSSSQEDLNDTAAAGYYDSVPDITAETLIEELTTYIFINSRLATKVAYEGSIVFHEQLDPDISGTLFSKNPTPNNGLGQNSVIAEIVAGHNRGVTAGSTQPTLVSIDRDAVNSGSARKIINPNEKLRLDSDSIRLLGVMGLRIEALFAQRFQNKPADIEWGISSGAFYPFQTRPITNY